MLAHFQKKKTGFCLGADIWGREQEGAEGVVERNRSEKNPELFSLHLHADDPLFHYMEGRCSY